MPFSDFQVYEVYTSVDKSIKNNIKWINLNERKCWSLRFLPYDSSHIEKFFLIELSLLAPKLSGILQNKIDILIMDTCRIFYKIYFALQLNIDVSIFNDVEANGKLCFKNEINLIYLLT